VAWRGCANGAAEILPYDGPRRHATSATSRGMALDGRASRARRRRAARSRAFALRHDDVGTGDFDRRRRCQPLLLRSPVARVPEFGAGNGLRHQDRGQARTRRRTCARRSRRSRW
jgi:hypothetical protein